MAEPLFPKGALPDRGSYPWLQGHPKAGTPPANTPLKSGDAAAKRGANALSYGKAK